MLRTLSRSSLRRVAGIVACATSIVVMGGCHQRSPVTIEPIAVARRFPGVDLVSTPHGGFFIRILSGLVGDGEPLYIIDGNPMIVDARRGIDWFKPEDIVRVSVLKSPSDLAVYGPRGVYGVILIATRQGATPR
jgi:hypothetical protein